MKTQFLKTAVLLTGFAACGLAHGLDQPKLTVDEFRAKLKKDESPLPANGTLQMSYANVVEKVMPSVVTITSSGKPKKGMGMEGMPQIPPDMEQFFRRWLGQRDEDGDGGGNPFDDQGQQQRPRRKGQGQQRPAPKEPAEQRLGLGSGMIITSDGYILTNNHVVEGADKLEVKVDLAGGYAKTFLAKVIGRDPLTDVALIKIDATGLSPATIGDSTKLRVGDIVLAAGAPMELAHSVTQGIVSALGRSDMGIVHEGKRAGFENFIQTDASINPGNSGGPLVDALGRMVGINTAIVSGSGMNAGIGFAIPVSMAVAVVEDLLANGKVQRGFLGVGPTDVSQEMVKDLGLPDQMGAVVMTVVSESPAEKAGVEVGDVIVSVAGKKVENGSNLRLIVSSHRPGEKITLDVLREKKKVTLNATLEELPDATLAGMVPGTPFPKRDGSGTSELISGVTAQDTNAALAEKYGLAKGVEGVVVTKVEPNSSAAAVGLTEGDVIQAINRQPVKNVGEAKAQVKSKNKKEAIYLKVHRKGDSILLVVRD